MEAVMKSVTMSSVWSLLAIYFLTLGAALFLAGQPDRIAYAADPACKACEAGWVGQETLFGNGKGECEHGPENDPTNCPALGPDFDPSKVCWELNGNKEWKAGKKCECFKCYGDKGCEPMIQQYYAWCKLETAENKGTCKTKAGTVEGFMIRERTAKTSDGKACAYDANPAGGYIDLKFCGKAMGPGGQASPGAALSCKTTSCVPDGEWENDPDSKGKLPVCDQ